MNKKDNSDKIKKLKLNIKLSPRIHSFVMNEFDQIDYFINFVKSALKRQKNITSKWIHEGARDLDREELESYYDIFSEGYLKIDEDFGRAAIAYSYRT